MAERTGRTQFAVAGWLFGSVSVVLGLAIHAVSGHPVPAPPIVVATAALLSLAGAVVTRIGVPNWALLVLAGVGQQVIHWAFALFSNPLATTLAGRIVGEALTDDERAARVVDRFLADLENQNAGAAQ